MGQPGSGIDDTETLVDAIHDAVEAPTPRPRTPRRIARTLDARSALLRTVDLRGNRAVRTTHHHNLDDDLQVACREPFVGAEPYLEAPSRLPTGRMVVNHALVDLDGLRDTELYRRYLDPLDNHFIAGGFVATVRSHLERVPDKTGTGRRADLVRLLAAASWKIAHVAPYEEVAR